MDAYIAFCIITAAWILLSFRKGWYGPRTGKSIEFTALNGTLSGIALFFILAIGFGGKLRAAGKRRFLPQ